MSSLKSLPRAIYAATKALGVRDGMVAIAAPNEAHRLKCEQHRSSVEAVLLKVTGAQVKLVLSVDETILVLPVLTWEAWSFFTYS